MTAQADGRERLLDAVTALASHEALDDPILAGVVADDREATARPQRGERAGERGRKHLELAVHRDAERLEGARGRVNPSRICAAGGRGGDDDLREVRGGHEPTLRTRRQDRRRDAACTAFFTKRREDSGELSLRRSVDEVEGR